MKVTGHETISIFNRYNITSEEDVANAMEKLDTYQAAQKSLEDKLANAPIVSVRRL